MQSRRQSSKSSADNGYISLNFCLQHRARRRLVSRVRPQGIGNEIVFVLDHVRWHLIYLRRGLQN